MTTPDTRPRSCVCTCRALEGGTIAAQLGVHPDVVRRILASRAAIHLHVPRPRLVDPFATSLPAHWPAIPHCARHDFTICSASAVSVVRPHPARVCGHRAAAAAPRGLSSHRAAQWRAGQIDWATSANCLCPAAYAPSGSLSSYSATPRPVGRVCPRSVGVFPLPLACARGQGPRRVTRQWLFDNPKTVVLERVGHAARFHPRSFHCALNARTASPVWRPSASTQGRVERAIRYLRDRFLAGRTILSVDDGNQQSNNSSPTLPIAPTSRAGPTHCRRCLAEERTRLSPCPTRAAHRPGRACPCRHPGFRSLRHQSLFRPPTVRRPHSDPGRR